MFCKHMRLIQLHHSVWLAFLGPTARIVLPEQIAAVFGDFLVGSDARISHLLSFLCDNSTINLANVGYLLRNSDSSQIFLVARLH